MLAGDPLVDYTVSMADEDAAARELGIQPNLSMDDLRDVYNVLFRLGISEPSVILEILDLAGFWLCSNCTWSEYVRVMDTDLVYVAVQAPNAPTREVTFISDSHDQGAFVDNRTCPSALTTASRMELVLV